MAYYVGLDLGQSADFTAIAIVQTVQANDQDGRIKTSLHLRHLERYPLGTPYTTVVDGVAKLVCSEALNGYEYDHHVGHHARAKVELVVDKTGVGVGVTDLLRARGLKFTSVTIHGGESVTRSGSVYNVPKLDLVAALEVPFHNETLKVAEGLELWPVLKKELQNFRRKINIKTGHERFEHWRDSDHDDLVLAAALACWKATLRRRGRTRMRVYR